MSLTTIYTLVPSSNRGRYAPRDPETGHDLTSGEPIAILLGGKWTPGHIEQSGHYGGAGCYHIADSGRKYSERPDTPKAQEECERVVKPRVRAAIQKGLSLADAMSAATGQVVDLFCGNYFIASDGTVCGLCTGMHAHPVDLKGETYG